MDQRQRSESGNQPSVSELPNEEVLFGRSSAMDFVRKRVRKAGGATVPLLIEGEGGTGKEVLARWIHQTFTGNGGVFIKVNCAGIPYSLLESELFGYERGAFTGAHSSRPGRVELADRGTLFFDEITNLDLKLQSKLLHFLQDGRFARIGGNAERAVNTRVICASQKDLREQVDIGKFRADLLYRINVVQLRLPPLRERREDVPALAEYFRLKYMKQFERDCEPFAGEMMRELQVAEWPGNIRELSNCIARYVVLGREGPVEPRQDPMKLPSSASMPTGTIPLKHLAKEAIRKLERDIIVEALKANRWNRRKTAEALGISYRTVIYKIQGANLAKRGQASDVPGTGSGKGS